MRRNRRSSGGHTLIEVAIATAVLMLGILGALPLFFRAAAGATVGSKLVQATALARSKLDELTAAPFGSSPLVAGSYSDAKNLSSDGQPYAPGGASTGTNGAKDGWFGRTWTIEDAKLSSASPVDDYKRITVVVSWYDAPTKSVRTIALYGGRARPR